MSNDHDPILDAVTALIPPLLAGLEALRHAGRFLHPPEIGFRAAEIEPACGPLAAALEQFETQDWPTSLDDFRRALSDSARRAMDGLVGFLAACEDSNPVMAAYRALGNHWRSLEALYPVTAMLPPVSRFFLDEVGRADAKLAADLAAAAAGRNDAGVLHARNEPVERGGFSVYVPEMQRPEQPLPLIVALHGGSGHGRGFLWSWLRDARSRGCLLLAPTSADGTWSLMGPDLDSDNLLAMIDYVATHWPIDRSRILLTGMSDGGTFTWVAGLRDAVPYTHLAPVSGSFHPMLLEDVGHARLAGLPIYLVHGARDWMFPPDVARLAQATLDSAGADVTYRELPDLSHTYPVEENARILDWFIGPR